jgi:hypothetical protein
LSFLFVLLENKPVESDTSEPEFISTLVSHRVLSFDENAVNVVDNIEPEVKELESVSAIEEVEEKAELEILIVQIEDEVVPEKVEEQKTEENKNLESKPEKYEEEEKVVEKEKIVVIESQPEEVPTVEASSEAKFN